MLRGDAPAIGLRGGQPVGHAAFLAEIGAVAAWLPDQPYVVNLCTDRIRFAIAWAAAMRRGQVTLLPNSRDPATLAALRHAYPGLYALVDNEAPPIDAPVRSYPTFADAPPAMDVPAFPPDQIAALLFTSGSSGRPAATRRSWGRLVGSTRAAGAALGIARFAGAPLVATVPHAHSYGLESSVMLALQHGLLLTAETPLFPADVGAAFAAGGSPVLVTTPVHLRALLAAPDSTASSPPGLVLSATAPLPAELAARAEAAWGAPVIEVYGCTEAGQLATRRTTAGPAWRCLDGFSLRHDGAGAWAAGPAEPETLLADEIERTGGAGFLLHGRAADMVDVAGKRTSLAFLTRQLVTLDGVQDGVFVLPDQRPDDAPSRLAALAVAPGLDAATVLARLRDRLDPAFLPRPLRLVDALPRNALGKLPRAAILEALGVDRPPDAILHIPHDHPAGPGHFPGDPLIPGAALLDLIVDAICPHGPPPMIVLAKFHAPVRPGDTIHIVPHSADDGLRFEARLDGRLAVSGRLRSDAG